MPTVRQGRIRKAVPLAALVCVLAAGAISLTAIRRNRNLELQNNLYTLRVVIDNYTYDQGKEPRTYQDLVDKRYLRKIPAEAPSTLPGARCLTNLGESAVGERSLKRCEKIAHVAG